MGFDRIDDGSSVDVTVDLGAGLNTLTLDPMEIGFGDRGTVNMNVTGGAQKDTVTLNLHDDIGDGVKASAMNFKADLGAGHDVFTANLDYAGSVFRVDDHSVALITVKGGAGNDNLSANGVGPPAQSASMGTPFWASISKARRGTTPSPQTWAKRTPWR